MTKFTLIESGVIMRAGTFNILSYPGRTLREVHPARREESMTYRIEKAEGGPFNDRHDGWSHWRYRFIYRYMGRTLTVPYRAGLKVDSVRPADALVAYMDDAHAVDDVDTAEGLAYEFGYDMETESREVERIFTACNRANLELNRLFGGDWENRDLWDRAAQGVRE